MNSRISRDEMLMQMAVVAADRGTCSRRRVGAILAREHRVLSIGYNGSPPGEPHCIDVGCVIGPDGGCVRTIHAEANAIRWAKSQDIAVNGATLYCTDSPCLSCAKAIINAGVAEVKYVRQYRILDGLELLDAAGCRHSQLLGFPALKL